MTMKISVRDATFESNSSSTHSLSFSKDDVFDLAFDQNDLRAKRIRLRYPTSVDPQFVVYGGEWFRFYKPENILLYLLTQAAGGQIDESDNPSKLIGALAKQHENVRLLLETVLKETGCDVVFDSEGRESFGDLIVDHQSLGLGLEVIGSQEKLRQLLFGRKGFVETGSGIPPFHIRSDVGDVFYSPDLIDDGSGLVHWAEIEIIDHDRICYRDDEGIELQNRLNGFDVTDLFGAGQFRGHIDSFHVAMPAYVSSFPEEYRHMDEDAAIGEQVRVNDLLSFVLHTTRTRYRPKRKVRRMTISKGFEPSFHAVGSSDRAVSRLSDCSELSMKIRLDVPSRAAVRTFVGEFESEKRL
jgi:hypothetical protein